MDAPIRPWPTEASVRALAREVWPGRRIALRTAEGNTGRERLLCTAALHVHELHAERDTSRTEAADTVEDALALLDTWIRDRAVRLAIARRGQPDVEDVEAVPVGFSFDDGADAAGEA